MATKKCETCGKLLKTEDVRTINGIVECRDCAYVKTCSICGKTIKFNEVCKVFDKPCCAECAFPNGGKEEFKQFKNELDNINITKKAEYKKESRIAKFKWFLITIGIFIVIDLILVLISAIISGGQTALIASWFIFFVTYKIIANKKVPDFVPLTEKEYYQQKYTNTNA